MGDHLFGAGVALRNATEFLLVAQPNPVLTQAASAICSATDGNVEVNLQAVIEKAGAVAAEFAPRSWERRLYFGDCPPLKVWRPPAPVAPRVPGHL
jgi:hypothetical protein